MEGLGTISTLMPQPQSSLVLGVEWMEIERIRGRGVWPDNMARCTALYSTIVYKQNTEAVSEGFFVELYKFAIVQG